LFKKKGREDYEGFDIGKLSQKLPGELSCGRKLVGKKGRRRSDKKKSRKFSKREASTIRGEFSDKDRLGINNPGTKKKMERKKH